MEIIVEVVKGIEGDSLYINNRRVCGNKPLGGGEIIHHFEVKVEEIEQAITEFKEYPK